MSGVMTKVAVYGFVRIVFDLLGPPPWWWATSCSLLGGVTAVLGVLYALMQHDLKRLLAYHTVENIGIIFIGLGLALGLPGQRHGGGGGAGADRGAVPRLQSFAVQEPAVLRRRRGAHRDRRARHGAARRPHPPHAADRVRLPGRLRRDLGAAAAQRLRLRMADLPGDPAQPRPAAMGPEAHGAGGRRAAGAVGGARRRLLRQGLRRHLPRPAAQRQPAATAQRGRPLLARRDVRPRRPLPCSPASCPASSSTRWRRSRSLLAGGRMPVQAAIAVAVDRADRREPQLL